MDAHTLEGLLQLAAYGVTWLGSSVVLLPAALVVLWAVDRAGGRRLLVALGVSYAVNHLLKNLVGSPRPFEIDPALALEAARATAHGSSWPSGHTQAATVFWLTLAARSRWRARWWLAVLVIAMVAASRVLLAVHFPVDVLGGVLVGAGLAALAVRLPAERPGGRLLAAAVGAGLVAAFAGGEYGLPLGVAVGALAAAPPEAVPRPGGRALLVVGGGAGLVVAYLVVEVVATGSTAGGLGVPPPLSYLAVAVVTWLLAEAWPRVVDRRSAGSRPAGPAGSERS